MLSCNLVGAEGVVSEAESPFWELCEPRACECLGPALGGRSGKSPRTSLPAGRLLERAGRRRRRDGPLSLDRPEVTLLRAVVPLPSTLFRRASVSPTPVPPTETSRRSRAPHRHGRRTLRSLMTGGDAGSTGLATVPLPPLPRYPAPVRGLAITGPRRPRPPRPSRFTNGPLDPAFLRAPRLLGPGVASPAAWTGARPLFFVDRSSPQAVATLVSPFRAGLTAGSLQADRHRAVAGLFSNTGLRDLATGAATDQTTTPCICTTDVFVGASTTTARPTATLFLALVGLLPSPTTTTTLLGGVLADPRRAYLTVPHFAALLDTRRAARTALRGCHSRRPLGRPDGPRRWSLPR